MTPPPFLAGDRVRVTDSEHVCTYVHGAIGTVESVYQAQPWESTVFGPMLYRVKFDAPLVAPHGTELRSLGGLAYFDLEPIA